jgi:hypothetical protein
MDHGLARPLDCASSTAEPTYAGDMNTIHLTDEELEIAKYAMSAYLRSFGHDEADTVVLAKAVLARLATAQKEPDSSAAVG